MNNIEQFITDFITEMLEKYPTAYTWDVANEMISGSTDMDEVYISEIPWTKVDNFLCIAF